MSIESRWWWWLSVYRTSFFLCAGCDDYVSRVVWYVVCIMDVDVDVVVDVDVDVWCTVLYGMQLMIWYRKL